MSAPTPAEEDGPVSLLQAVGSHTLSRRDLFKTGGVRVLAALHASSAA